MYISKLKGDFIMDFNEQLIQFVKRVEPLKPNILTEEATKTSIIMPFFALLGYDVFNPSEFMPEYIADVGIKKGEKVDYAILQNNEPAILIETKWIGEALQKHDSQLFRYFGTSKAKFAILTNGQYFKFFTELEEKNKMDELPFLEINLFDLKDSQITELKKFHKSNFDVNSIFNTASELKYSNEFKTVFSTQLNDPSDEFVRFFLNDCYEGVKTQAVIERFRPVLKKTLNNYISELMNDKIKQALEPKAEAIDVDISEELVESVRVPNIVTTEQELEAMFIIKNIVRDIVAFEDITYKDTESYFGVLYKNNTRKWICRLILKENQKILIIPIDDKQEKYILENVYDIEKYKDIIIDSVRRFI